MRPTNRSQINRSLEEAGLSEDETDSISKEQGEVSAQPRSRRDFLKYGGAAAVGLVAGTMLNGDGAEATNGEPLVLGVDTNQATSITYVNVHDANFTVEKTGGGGSALYGVGGPSPGAGGVGGYAQEGHGVSGESVSGAGVHGSSESGDGLLGFSDTGFGVSGFSDSAAIHGRINGDPNDYHPTAGTVGGIFFGYTGVEAHGTAGPGVAGNSEAGSGIAGHSEGGPGVSGASESGPGVQGFSGGLGDGVLGHHSGGGAGVRGFSMFGRGIEGGSDSGIGVLGHSPGLLPSVQAESREPKGGPDHGVALGVLGKAAFSNAGKGSIPKDKDSSDWIEPPDGLTGNSHVQVTLTNDPGGGRSVQYVQMNMGGDGKFKVHLTPGSQRKETGFTYQVNEFPPEL